MASLAEKGKDHSVHRSRVGNVTGTSLCAGRRHGTLHGHFLACGWRKILSEETILSARHTQTRTLSLFETQ